nr:solute carrier family 2, facilitated glucose transporter member 11 isoform X4 [Oryctolagus cuniculus]
MAGPAWGGQGRLLSVTVCPPLCPQIQSRVLFLTIFAAGIGGTFQFGYNLSIINAPTLYIQEFTNETWQVRTGEPLPDRLILLVWSLIVSLYPLGGLLGALLAGHLAVMLGRKRSLLVNDLCVVAAAVLFGFSRRAGSFEMIMLGRLLVGVSAGVSMNVQPMYLGESAPKELRGAVTMTSAIFTALGIMMGQVVGLRELLGGPQAWPLLLASCVVPGLLQLSSLPLLPESPRYLLIDRGDTKACLAALRRLRGSEDVEEELVELREERAACGAGSPRRPWHLLGDPALRRQVVSLVVLGSAMELCGNDSVYAYASAVFRAAGMLEHRIPYALVGTGACELLASLVSSAVVERVGRRVLLMGGYCLMTCWGSVFTTALCLQDSYPWMPYLAMSCVFGFILSFGIGPAGVTGILATELFDQTARPAAYVVYGVLLWTMLLLVGLGFPFLMVSLPCPVAPASSGAPISLRTPGGLRGGGVLGERSRSLLLVSRPFLWRPRGTPGLGVSLHPQEGLAHFIYVPFLAVCVCGAVYTGLFLPETKGKSFLEITQELHRLNFPRDPRWRGPEVLQFTEL